MKEKEKEKRMRKEKVKEKENVTESVVVSEPEEREDIVCEYSSPLSTPEGD